MKIKAILCVAALVMTQTGLGYAEETKTENKENQPVVVTATKTATPSSELSATTTVITSEMIENSKALTVVDALRQVSGVEINQSGGIGSTSSVYMRGAKSGHTLVMLDGMVLNDAISTGKIFDFANLPVDGIEKIEIVKGAQSTLYGSEAIGGVINIITKKGKKDNKINLSLEAGSFDTFKENINFGTANEKGNVFFSATQINSDSISVANTELEGNDEDDKYRNTTVLTNATAHVTDKLDLSFNLRYTDFEKDIDNGSGAYQDDLSQVNSGKEYQVGVSSTYTNKDADFTSKLSFSQSGKDWKDNDSDSADFLESSFLGKVRNAEWQVIKKIKNNTLTGGLNYSSDEGKSSYYSESSWGVTNTVFEPKKTNTRSIYLQDQIAINDSIFPTIGIRHDKHSKFGDETTYKVGVAYLIHSTGTKLKTTYGTGFKAPSVYQLYSSFGSENLKAETSKSFDIGFEQSFLNDKVSTEVVYFQNDIDDMIDYSFATSTYDNVAEAKTKGVEVNVNAKLTEKLDANLNYTYTDTEDKDGVDLLRRADNKANLTLNYKHSEKLQINFAAKYVGDREDITFVGFSSQRVVNDSYIVCDLNASFKVNDTLSVYGKITNIFDENYEDVYGYGTEGTGYFAGCKISV